MCESVFLKHVFERECSVTLITHMWFDIIMLKHVSLQGCTLEERFVALFASVGAKANVLVVDVSSQTEHGDIGCTAHFTRVGSLA